MLTSPCLGGIEKVLCISSRIVINWMTQWSFQWPPLFTTSTSSLTSSNWMISGFFRATVRFLVNFDCSTTLSGKSRFSEPAVRSTGALGLLWLAGGNPIPGRGGLKDCGKRKGIWTPGCGNPPKNDTGGMLPPCRWNPDPIVGGLAAGSCGWAPPACVGDPCESMTAKHMHNIKVWTSSRVETPKKIK